MSRGSVAARRAWCGARLHLPPEKLLQAREFVFGVADRLLPKLLAHAETSVSSLGLCVHHQHRADETIQPGITDCNTPSGP